MTRTANSQRSYSQDRSICKGQLHASRRVSPLRHNIMNMEIARHSIGAKKWTECILKALRAYDYLELAPIIGTSMNPVVPEFISRRSNNSFQHWATLRANALQREGRAKQKARTMLTKLGPPKQDKRVLKALDDLEKCPIKWMHWLTVITRPSLSREESLVALEREGKKLKKPLRERFPHVRFIIVPEVDLVLAKNMCTSLFSDTRWRQVLPNNQIVFKNHFHCIVYVPGFTSDEMERALQYTQNGRRSKTYGGKKQLLAKNLHSDPTGDDDTPDVHGCINYSRKRFFVPCVSTRPLETAAEWMWLTDMIERRPKLIRTGGFNNQIREYCTSCKSYHTIDDQCLCKIAFQEGEGFNDDDQFLNASAANNGDHDNVNQVGSGVGLTVYQEPLSDSSGNLTSRSSIYLNYLPARIWNNCRNSGIQVINGARRGGFDIVSAVWKFLFPSNGP